MLHAYTTDIMEWPEGTDPLKAPDPPFIIHFHSFQFPCFVIFASC